MAGSDDDDDDSDYEVLRHDELHENRSSSSGGDVVAGSNTCRADDNDDSSSSSYRDLSSDGEGLNDGEENGRRSKLSELIESGQYDLARERCKAHPEEVLSKDYEGWTAMHFLCMTVGRDTEATLELVHAMIVAVPLSKSMLVHDNSGITPFHYFCEDLFYASHMPTMTTMLDLFLEDKGAKVAEQMDNESMLPLHTMFCCSDSALKPLPAASELLAVFRKLLRAYPEAASKTCNESGMLPLHMACKYFVPNLMDNVDLRKAIVDVVKLLILSFPDAVSKRDLSNRYPLHHLSKHANPANNEAMLDVYRLLIDYNPSLAMKYNSWCESPIDIFWSEHVNGEPLDDVKCKVAELLLRAVHRETWEEPSSIDQRWLPIHAAVRLTCPWNFLEELIRRYPNQLTERDGNGDTPLHIHLKYRIYGKDDSGKDDHHTRFFGALLRSCRILASVPDASGRLPLHIAIERGSLDWDNGLRLLMDSAPTAVITRDIQSHFYPFMFAAMALRTDSCYRLLRNSPGVMGVFTLSVSENSGDCSTSMDVVGKTKRKRIL